MKFGDDKSKAPASFLFLAGAWLNLEPLRLDSTSAVSESHPFSRDSRRGGRGGAYRYDVFQITLCHLHVYKFAIKPIIPPTIQSCSRRRIGTLYGVSSGRDTDILTQAGR